MDMDVMDMDVMDMDIVDMDVVDMLHVMYFLSSIASSYILCGIKWWQVMVIF